MPQHREWNPKAFIRKLSPALWDEYATSVGIPLVPTGRAESKDLRYRIWGELDPGRVRTLEIDLRLVNDLCSTHARAYLNDLARQFHQAGRIDWYVQSLDWSIHDLAMRLFLDFAKEVRRCHQLYALDQLEHFREYRGRHPFAVTPSHAAKATIREAMRQHFRDSASGAFCQVEDFATSDKFALYIYHQGEMTPEDDFDGSGMIVPVWRRPVTSIAAVFYPTLSTLLVKAPREPDRERLRQLFEEIFVGEAGYFEDVSKINRFEFTPLAKSDFEFTTKMADGIDAVHVTRLIVSREKSSIRTMALDLRKDLSLEKVRCLAGCFGIGDFGSEVKGINLQFTFAGKGRGRRRTVSLVNPNKTNLQDTPRDRVIRGYLSEWRIDARATQSSVADPSQPDAEKPRADNDTR